MKILLKLWTQTTDLPGGSLHVVKIAVVLSERIETTRLQEVIQRMASDAISGIERISVSQLATGEVLMKTVEGISGSRKATERVRMKTVERINVRDISNVNKSSVVQRRYMGRETAADTMYSVESYYWRTNASTSVLTYIRHLCYVRKEKG